MRAWKPLTLGVAAAAIATATFVPLVPTGRGVQPLFTSAAPVEPGPFDPEQSAALFVGVRKFNEQTVEVPYAADDAVDLAYTFALDRRVKLVSPRRVVLALSGRPQKEESRQRLEELQQAGAIVEQAERSDILMLLQKQAAIAGKDGMLILSLATHGVTHHGVPHILGASSIAHRPETTVSAMELFDIAARSHARRSLIFVDACRERIAWGTRSGERDPSTAAPLIRRMTPVAGQVIFYAAAAGGYAYDDPVHENGVFTKAVIDGLHCRAAKSRGCVTAETLRKYVDRRVQEWIRANRDPGVGAATQIIVDGNTDNMPLSNCDLPPMGPVRAAAEGSTLVAFDRNGGRLWHQEVPGLGGTAIVADLDANGHNEVIAGLNDGIVAFDADRKRLWSAREGMTLRAFVVANRYREPIREVVALFDSRLAIFDLAGKRRSTYDHAGPLRHLAVDRPTSRHAWKIVVAAADRVFVLNPKKVVTGSHVWCGVIEPRSESIERLEIVDRGGRRHIAVSTAGGTTFVVDFDGTVVDQRKGRAAAQFSLVRR